MDTGKRPPHEAHTRPALPAGAPSIALALALLGVSWWALPRSVQAGDAGEFATVMLRGGIPHPSGYPWMRVLGLLAASLETIGLRPALAASLPCAMAGIAAWLVVQRTAAAWGYATVGAVVMALVATSAVVVGHVNDSEVWGLHLLACAILLHQGLVRRRAPVVLGGLLGLAASHHLTAVLLIPFAVGAAWPDDDGVRPLLRAGAQGVVGSALGLLPYLTLAIGGGGAWRWGDTRSFSGLVHHVGRADYGVTQLSLHTESVSMLDLWARAATSIGGALSARLTVHVGLAVGLLILILVLARRPERVRRPAWIGLWASIGAATVLFPALQNIDPNRTFGAWILERFDLLPILLWTLPAITVVGRLVDSLREHKLRVLLAIVPAALLTRQLAETWFRGVPSEEHGVQAYAVDLLETPPGPALIFGTDDHRTFPVLFAAEVLGTRPDVLYLDASLLHHAWYRNRATTAWPGLPLADKPLNSMALVWRDDRFRDTPIYVANLFSRPAATELRLVPEGVLWRVIPPHADPSEFAATEVARRHLSALRRYRARATAFAGLHSPDGHPWSVDLWHPYVDNTRRLSASVRATGDDALADQLDAALRELGELPADDGN